MHRYVTLIIVHAGFVSHYTLYADIHRWALGCCACAWRRKKIVRQIAFPLVPVGYILVGLTVCVSGTGLCNCVIISYPFRSKKLQLHAQRKYMMLNQMKGRWENWTSATVFCMCHHILHPCIRKQLFVTTSGSRPPSHRPLWLQLPFSHSHTLFSFQMYI